MNELVSTDVTEIETWLTGLYESVLGTTVQPGSPERLFLQVVTSVVVHERELLNYAVNQNIPSRAVGENLDILAELFYAKERPAATAASCVVRFILSEPQETSILIPAGTRVTDKASTLYWATDVDAYIPSGDISVDLDVTCQTVGKIGNEYAIGQINNLVDVFEYYSSCQNITESGGGSDAATDEEFYETLRTSEDAYSSAGSFGGYAYFAKSVSTEIADVRPNSPIPGCVYIYALMKDGTPANEEVKQLIQDACDADTLRPLTDYVQTADPELVSYDIDLTYYLMEDAQVSASEIEANVNSAVEEYTEWQYAKLGRDINPSKLYHLLMAVDGVKRIEIRSPVFTPLRTGKVAVHVNDAAVDLSDTVPQYAGVQSVIVLNGGYEDE